ncbi:polyphosphate kinase 2 family protein [Beijerinckia sp. L45]|uniref:polyphosphate kinase 2 family protein n=1 Tax=Beijerinckia sp. L45 TaxID=1641855 RepID=UPI001FEECDE5|nr:polyphosphate kinase 2 family protein [Beijerinckia sp. L45]
MRYPFDGGRLVIAARAHDRVGAARDAPDRDTAINMSGKTSDDQKKLSAKDITKVLDRYRIASGDGFKLADHAPDDLFPADLVKSCAEDLLQAGVARLAALQEKLYANGTWSVLVVLQALDAAGKDSTVKHVMSGVNPQGVTVTSFKAPTANELAHDFLWRISAALPERGKIGVFNRSHYEDVIVGRARPELLGQSRLPPRVAQDVRVWERRQDDIVAFERHLANEGTKVLKIFLNVGREEQKKRLLARLDDPDKTWKFDAGDLKTRALWPAYHEAYQTVIAATATPEAPWFVVPADRKWFTRWVVVEAIIEALSALDLQPPPLTPEDRAANAQARAALERD